MEVASLWGNLFFPFLVFHSLILLLHVYDTISATPQFSYLLFPFEDFFLVKIWKQLLGVVLLFLHVCLIKLLTEVLHV